jgi:DNA repair protein SbcC/Rad50
MRPVRLEIEGLTSFRQRQEIDFADFDLFVITGPTGAGKTTILDAITLALYGEVPRTGKKNAADLVTHGETRARVLLEFRADGKTYRVSRVLPRNGAQKATLERRDGDDWRPEVEESGVRPINARIEAIIGLDFDGFTRAVLLPQGEFAQFLSGDASQRRDILVRLLDLGRYEKAGQLARQEADRLSTEISAKSQLLAEDYADVTKEGVAAAAEAAKETKTQAEFKTEAGEKVDQLVSRLTELENQLTSIEQGTTALSGVGKALDVLGKEWARLKPQEAETEAALLRARTDLGKAKEEQRKATAFLETVCGRTGDEGLLAALDAACAALVRETKALVEISRAIEIAEKDTDRLGRALAIAAGELENAKARDAAARTAEEASRDQADRIAQAVQRARERAEAERNVSKLTAESGRWRNELEARRATLKGLETEVNAAEERLSHLNSEHAAIGIRAGLTVGKPCPVCLQLILKTPASASDIASSIKAAQDNAQAVTRRLRKAEGAVTEAITEGRGVDRSLAEATKKLRCAEQRGVLGQLFASCGIKPVGKMKAPRQTVDDEIAVIGEWRRIVTTELDHLRTTAEKEQKRETTSLNRMLTTLNLSLTTSGLPKIQAAVRKAVHEASIAATRAADNAASMKRKLARRREMETQMAEARERERLHRALADELRQNRFINYLLGESISSLATLASAELGGISGERYGLIAEQTGFMVMDHANADETRSVDTLSGGETFLASLSLATALARSITDIAGDAIGSRLEAMFIDEGFGALDAEALDAAIDALERFRDSERLVGVITHVSQLAERIPDGLVVEREGASSRIRTR